MAIDPADRFFVVTLTTQIYCARVQAGDKTPDTAACASQAVAIITSVDRHMAPSERRRREKPPTISLKDRRQHLEEPT